MLRKDLGCKTSTHCFYTRALNSYVKVNNCKKKIFLGPKFVCKSGLYFGLSTFPQSVMTTVLHEPMTALAGFPYKFLGKTKQ